jgi:hypothetical protein
MKIEDAKEAYEALSGKASDIMRQLGLGGIALIWLFRVDTAKGPTLDNALLRAALCICTAIICDFLQYVIGATIWFLHFRRKEKEGLKQNHEFTVPPHLNWPTWTLFFMKTVLLLVAYGAFFIPFLLAKFAA